MDGLLDQITLPAGSVLFVEGDSGTCAFLITSGRIEIFVLREDREVILATRGPGEIVGEVAMIDNGPRSASARVTEACQLILVTADQIAHRIAQTDPILRMCLSVVIGRYREALKKRDAGHVTFETAAGCDPFHAALETLSLESELRRAVRNGEFELFYQPIVSLPSCRLAGFESLLRWHHPQRGYVSPADFIPVAEANGSIVEITAWCLSEAGRTFPEIMRAALRNAAGVDPLFLTINISGHDLTSPGFARLVAAMLETSGIAPATIKLEVTESVLMKDPVRAAATLEECRTLGVGVAIDDFGTGYSSLSHLINLPVTALKIDQSFVRSMGLEPASRKIIAMILRLAGELDIPVVAEGIESREEAHSLSGLGCAFAQGYFFGKPQRLAPALQLIETWRPSRIDQTQAGPAQKPAGDMKSLRAAASA